MPNYGGHPDHIPWWNYQQFITSMEIGSGVSYLSPFSGFNLENCTSITILNKNITLAENYLAVARDDLVIYGYEGSTAQTYAESKSITFVPLD